VEERQLIASAGDCPRCATPMPLADRHPQGWREWARRVAYARDKWGRARYLHELELIRERAEESADRGEYADALSWLETLEALDEPLSDEWEAKRRAWHESLRTARIETASGGRPSDPGRASGPDSG
jgi:hypothetical protein